MIEIKILLGINSTRLYFIHLDTFRVNYRGENKVLTSLILANKTTLEPPWGGRLLPCKAYMGMCRWTGYVQEFERSNFTCKGKMNIIDLNSNITLLLIFTLIYVS